MKAGDRVRKDQVMNVKDAVGVIEKISREYVVVVWDGINGHWHYTPEQAKLLEVLQND